MLLGSACGGWRGYGDTYYAHWTRSGKVNHEATFKFGTPPQGWRPVKQKGAQVVWVHNDTHAVIHLGAQCEMHGDSSLESFTDHLRIDFREWKLLSQEATTLAGRDAVQSVVLASIDGGTQTQMELLVMKKNGCLFDLQYIAPPSDFERGRAAFRQVVAGFTFPVKE